MSLLSSSSLLDLNKKMKSFEEKIENKESEESEEKEEEEECELSYYRKKIISSSNRKTRYSQQESLGNQKANYNSSCARYISESACFISPHEMSFFLSQNETKYIFCVETNVFRVQVRNKMICKEISMQCSMQNKRDIAEAEQACKDTLEYLFEIWKCKREEEIRNELHSIIKSDKQSIVEFAVKGSPEKRVPSLFCDEQI